MEFIAHSVDVLPLSRGSLKGISFKDGGGFRVVGEKDGMYFQYHPKKATHHKDEYYKISSGKAGAKRYNLNGEIIE